MLNSNHDFQNKNFCIRKYFYPKCLLLPVIWSKKSIWQNPVSLCSSSLLFKDIISSFKISTSFEISDFSLFSLSTWSSNSLMRSIFLNLTNTSLNSIVGINSSGICSFFEIHEFLVCYLHLFEAILFLSLFFKTLS